MPDRFTIFNIRTKNGHFIKGHHQRRQNRRQNIVDFFAEQEPVADNMFYIITRLRLKPCD